MRQYPQLTARYPPPTLIEQWERAHRTQKSREDRNIYPSDLTQFLSDLKESPLVLDSAPGTLFESHNYRIELYRKAGTLFCTLAIQTSEPDLERVCNLHISLEDVKSGSITADVVKEAFRNMFETRRWKQGGHMTIFRDERPSSDTKGAVVYVYGRPMGGA